MVEIIHKDEHKRGRLHYGYAHRHNRGISLKIHTVRDVAKATSSKLQKVIPHRPEPRGSELAREGGIFDVGVDVDVVQ